MVENYRPVSLLPIIDKIFEKSVHKCLEAFFAPFLCDEQHGFVRNRSVETNLAVFNDYITGEVDRKHEVHTIYTDFSKAFDSVCHSLLMKKLSFYGIRGSLLQWLGSYLTDNKELL